MLKLVIRGIISRRKEKKMCGDKKENNKNR